MKLVQDEKKTETMLKENMKLVQDETTEKTETMLKENMSRICKWLEQREADSLSK